MFCRCILLTSALILGLSIHSVNAEDIDKGEVTGNCAVSQPNGKIEFASGRAENNSVASDLFHGAVALSTPLNCLFGLQVDGLVAHLDGDTALAGGVHLFARDPNRYLLGFYGDVSGSDTSNSFRLGLEGELYLDRFTLSGTGGWEDNNAFSDDNFFGVGQLSFYPDNNLNISVGIAHTSGESFATFGSEWLPQGSPVSLFTQGATDGDNFHSINVGIRIHFGATQKSLIRRHREDDPNILLSGPLNIGTKIATFKREERRLNEIATVAPVQQPVANACTGNQLNCKAGYSAQEFMGSCKCLPTPRP